jgi:hypothetical protein
MSKASRKVRPAKRTALPTQVSVKAHDPAR